MRIFITGGSGFVGTYLSQVLLDQGHILTISGTSPASQLADNPNLTYIRADTTQPGPWQEVLQEMDAVVNMAGRNIFKPWTEKYKAQIHESRILTTRNLVNALPENRPVVLCSTSAAGYYGDRADEKLDETATPGDDFLAEVCIAWENEAFLAEQKGARVAVMRFGVVLGKNGGALAKMTPAFKFLVGGPLGDGSHWFPWIHLDDLVAAVQFILANEDISGAVNFGSPNPVQNRTFAKTLGRVLQRPAFMPAPAFIIKLVMGELGRSLLNSQRIIPAKLLATEFEFRYPELEKALEASIH